LLDHLPEIVRDKVTDGHPCPAQIVHKVADIVRIGMVRHRKKALKSLIIIKVRHKRATCPSDPQGLP
jgi:hypothetical protein